MSEARKETKPSAPTPETAAEYAGDDWLTLPQAAKAIGKHRQTVLVLGAGGELTLDRRAKMTFVTRASVDAYLARQGESVPVAASA